MFGRELHAIAMSHQYILFEEVPEVRAWSEAEGRKVPYFSIVMVHGQGRRP